MGTWSYLYDNNGNLYSQTDALGQQPVMSYDALNRLTGKTYPGSATTLNVNYGYDAGTNGKGQRTSMNDYVTVPTTPANYSYAYQYDTRGRLTQESQTITSVQKTTSYVYDSADRLYQIGYPTGETVTQQFGGRGLPSGLSSNASGVGTLVSNTL